jgi:hypothetical protein
MGATLPGQRFSLGALMHRQNGLSKKNRQSPSYARPPHPSSATLRQGNVGILYRAKKSGQRMGRELLHAIHVNKKGCNAETLQPLVFTWCLGRESNSHRTKFRGILSPLRLPIPPPRHALENGFLNIIFTCGCQGLIPLTRNPAPSAALRSCRGNGPPRARRLFLSPAPALPS